MSRYIDADALIKRIQDEHKFGSLMLSNMIAEMPTADVVPMKFHERCMELEIKKRANMVEVVRCKDCKYRGKMVCPFGIRRMPRDNDFCFYGERREDAT